MNPVRIGHLIKANSAKDILYLLQPQLHCKQKHISKGAGNDKGGIESHESQDMIRALRNRHWNLPGADLPDYDPVWPRRTALYTYPLLCNVDLILLSDHDVFLTAFPTCSVGRRGRNHPPLHTSPQGSKLVSRPIRSDPSSIHRYLGSIALCRGREEHRSAVIASSRFTDRFKTSRGSTGNSTGHAPTRRI